MCHDASSASASTCTAATASTATTATLHLDNDPSFLCTCTSWLLLLLLLLFLVARLHDAREGSWRPQTIDVFTRRRRSGSTRLSCSAKTKKNHDESGRREQMTPLPGLVQPLQARRKHLFGVILFLVLCVCVRFRG